MENQERDEHTEVEREARVQEMIARAKRELGREHGKAIGPEPTPARQDVQTNAE
jgi:hypothetical protein